MGLNDQEDLVRSPRDKAPETGDSLHEKIQFYLKSWSVKEKIGQLFILAFPGKDPGLIAPLVKEYNIGGCYLSQDNAETFEEGRHLSRELQEYTTAQTPSVPLILGVDQEGAWGVLVPESVTGPGNMALGAADDPSLTKRIYRIFGQQMNEIGFNTILGPCSDVNLNPESPIIGTRSFGEFPEDVARHVEHAVQGIRDGNAISAAKHFPGHGATGGDTHREIPWVDKDFDSLWNQDLLPFRKAVRAGADMIMTSHIRYLQIDKENPATLSSIILQDILREKMKFRGVILSDSMNMGAIRRFYNPADSVIKAFKAGVDMIMLSEEHYDHSENYLEKQIASLEAVIKAVEVGDMNEAEIDQKLTRVLALKLSRLSRSENVLPPLSEREIKDTEQKAAEKSLTLIRNTGQCWPLPPDSDIYCFNATPESSYRNLINPRGIGPNQKIPAFQTFHETLSNLIPEIKLLKEIPSALPSDNTVFLLITEDYPLPGEDFEKEEQKKMIREFLSRFPDRCLLLGLRSSYEMKEYIGLKDYLSSYSSRTCSAQAMARAIAGLIPLRGKLPVSGK